MWLFFFFFWIPGCTLNPAEFLAAYMLSKLNGPHLGGVFITWMHKTRTIQIRMNLILWGWFVCFLNVYFAYMVLFSFFIYLATFTSDKEWITVLRKQYVAGPWLAAFKNLILALRWISVRQPELTVDRLSNHMNYNSLFAFQEQIRNIARLVRVV